MMNKYFAFDWTVYSMDVCRVYYFGINFLWTYWWVWVLNWTLTSYVLQLQSLMDLTMHYYLYIDDNGSSHKLPNVVDQVIYAID